MPLNEAYRDDAIYAAKQAAEWMAKDDVYMAMMKLGEAQRQLALAMTWGEEGPQNDSVA